MSSWFDGVSRSLMDAVTTLQWSVYITLIACFLFLAIKHLQGQKKKKTHDRFNDLRNVIAFSPFIWLLLNFSSDANYLATMMFAFWFPIVVFSIFTLGLAELVLPVWYGAKKTGSGLGRKRGGSMKRRS